MGIINLLLQGSTTNLPILLTVFVLALFISTFWISLHADASEALQIIVLLDQHFTKISVGEGMNSEDRQGEVFKRMKLRSGLQEELEEDYNSRRKK